MKTNSPSPFEPITLSLKEFLQIESCPPQWKHYDLYIIRDDQVAFYVGQSYVAFERVWNHIKNGYKGRSVIGRFILSNWPAAMKFTIELHCSGQARFAEVQYDLNQAEQVLIEERKPCFNCVLNNQPAHLPECYIPPEVRVRVHRLHRMIREASYVLQAEQKKEWLK